MHMSFLFLIKFPSYRDSAIHCRSHILYHSTPDNVSTTILISNQLVRNLRDDVQGNNTENETNTEHHNDHWIHNQTGSLVSVQLKHRRTRAARAGRAGRAWALVCNVLLVLLGCSAAVNEDMLVLVSYGDTSDVEMSEH
jgi:hypothetical protein